MVGDIVSAEKSVAAVEAELGIHVLLHWKVMEFIPVWLSNHAVSSLDRTVGGDIAGT